jgi:hypothetical protein
MKFELDKVKGLWSSMSVSLNKKCVLYEFIFFLMIASYLAFIFDPIREIQIC